MTSELSTVRCVCGWMATGTGHDVVAAAVEHGDPRSRIGAESAQAVDDAREASAIERPGCPSSGGDPAPRPVPAVTSRRRLRHPVRGRARGPRVRPPRDPVFRDDPSEQRPRVVTTFEGHVAEARRDDLLHAFKGALATPEPGLVRTFLLQQRSDPTVWRVVTLWRDAAALDSVLAAGPPRGPAILRAAGSEHPMLIVEVEGQPLRGR